jgi:transcriptional regulator with XRE-family HTH domain
VTQNGTWSDRVAAQIAAEVRRYRQQARMSTQQVADECEKRGLTIKRSVLANLESGRRTTLSVPELLVLADVLRVPPLILLFPIGLQEATEVLPGVTADPWHAAQWFMGATGDPGDPSAERPPGGRALWYWQEHDRYAAIVRDAHERLGRAVDSYEASQAAFEATSTEIERRQELARSEARHLSTAAMALQSLRETIAQVGLLPPPLSPDVANILGNWSRRPPQAGDEAQIIIAQHPKETGT